MLEGKLRTWYPGKAVMEERLYKDGRLEGLTSYYDEHGRLTGQTVFAAGEPVEAREFFENGGCAFRKPMPKASCSRKIFDRKGRVESEQAPAPEHKN